MADSWNSRLLNMKKDLVRRTVKRVWSAYQMKKGVPQINFAGCPAENSWNQLAHYHPSENKICISERQLTTQDFEELKSTIVHEITHALGMFKHGSAFENVKNDLSVKTWRPPSGALYVQGGRSGKKTNTKGQKKPISSKTRCNKNGCLNKIAGNCKYCKKGFCNVHLTARVVTSLNEIMNLNANTDYEKAIKYNEDWRSSDGHSCPQYTEIWRYEKPAAPVTAKIAMNYSKRSQNEVAYPKKEPKPSGIGYYKGTSDLKPVAQPTIKTAKKQRKGTTITVFAVLFGIGIVFAALVLFTDTNLSISGVTHNNTPSSSLTAQTTVTTPQITQHIDRFVITEREYSMTPNVIIVHSGDLVILNVINNGTEGEDFFIEGVTTNLPVMLPSANGTLSFTVPTTGNYSYFSSVKGHRDLGLVGTMEVLPSS